MFNKNIDYKMIKPNTKFIGQNVFYFETVDSTNTAAKNTSCNNGDLFIAEAQTAGRGRMGRMWDSEKGVGIFMSISIVPETDAEQINRLTLVAGLAVCKTLTELYNLPFKIKWPNDIVLDGKKVCGILTEGVISEGTIKKVVVGIGINVNNKHFCDELAEKATSLYILTNKQSDRVKIINRFAEIFEEQYLQFLQYGIKTVLENYKELCITLNKEVFIVNNNQTTKSYAIDIADTGELMVKKEDGTTLTVNSGEVSVRGIYGYN